jgi:Ca2+-transporting ATPase
MKNYLGLTFEQVLTNRKLYGANTISPLFKDWQIILGSLPSFWLIKLLFYLIVITIFVLPLLDLCGIKMSLNVWMIALILPILLSVVYIVLLLTCEYDADRKRCVISPYITIILLLILFYAIIKYIKSVFIEELNWAYYMDLMVLCAIIILLVFVRFSYKSRKNITLAKKNKYYRVNVIRQGEMHAVSSRDLVVDDIICLSTGDEVPADAELLEAEDLVVNEYTITGESVSIKCIEDLCCTPIPTNHIYRGSTILQGKAVAKVCAVGKDCRFNRL